MQTARPAGSVGGDSSGDRTDLGEILRQNPLADVVLGRRELVTARGDGHANNLVWALFTDKARRVQFPDLTCTGRTLRRVLVQVRASGATAVQIVEKRSGVRRIVEHVGSAHDEVELAVLVQVALKRLHAGQQALDVGLDAAVVRAPRRPRARARAGRRW